MKVVLTSVAALALSGTVAFAQDGSAWDGAYGGITGSSHSGDMLYDDGGAFDLDGNSVGLIVGYNLSNGPLVYGGELSYSDGDVEEVGNPGFLFTSFLDFKARVGYSAGNALIYGTVGATASRWTESDESFGGRGFLYGIGVDYLVSPTIFLGGEYVIRDIENDWNTDGDTLDADLGTLSLRLGMKF
jgi:outer membrane immunogenic protein